MAVNRLEYMYGYCLTSPEVLAKMETAEQEARLFGEVAEWLNAAAL
jgi:hypothetical protein